MERPPIPRLVLALIAASCAVRPIPTNLCARTNHVVLSRGFCEQEVAPLQRRPTTIGEKQSLLAHELPHIALDRDDDDLSRRAFCPLRLPTLSTP